MNHYVITVATTTHMLPPWMRHLIFYCIYKIRHQLFRFNSALRKKQLLQNSGLRFSLVVLWFYTLFGVRPIYTQNEACPKLSSDVDNQTFPIVDFVHRCLFSQKLWKLTDSSILSVYTNQSMTNKLYHTYRYTCNVEIDWLACDVKRSCVFIRSNDDDKS